MKITKQVTIPAKTEEIECYKCDVCGFEMGVPNCHCRICSADLCRNCLGTHYMLHAYESGQRDYCPNCWDVGTAHRDRIASLQKQIDNEYYLWAKRAKEPAEEPKE